MKLSLINQIWLEKTAAQYVVPPEALLNAIIRVLVNRPGSKAGHCLRKYATAGVADESVIALLVYLMRLEEERKDAFVDSN